MPSKPPFLSTDTKKSTVTGAEGGTPTADFTVDSLFPHSLACSSWGRQEKTEDSVGVREGPAYGRLGTLHCSNTNPEDIMSTASPTIQWTKKKSGELWY